MKSCQGCDLLQHPCRFFGAVAAPLQVEVTEGTPVPPAAPGKFQRDDRDERCLRKIFLQRGKIGAVVRDRQRIEGSELVCRNNVFSPNPLLPGGQFRSAAAGRMVSVQGGTEVMQCFFTLSLDNMINVGKDFQEGFSGTGTAAVGSDIARLQELRRAAGDPADGVGAGHGTTAADRGGE